MQRVMVLAPHPDDETLGCGGTILKHVRAGDEVHWLILTPSEEVVPSVAKRYGVASLQSLNLPAARLDALPMSDLVGAIGEVFRAIGPNRVYVPYPGDAHTDHRYAFEAAMACTKWFRYPTVSTVLSYEVLSETEFGISPLAPAFSPNYFVDISEFIEEKIDILGLYASELGDFPFPRSLDAVRAQAALRGAIIGAKAAEAFMVLKEVWK